MNVTKLIYKNLTGIRPWEDKNQIIENTDLSRSSGNLVAKEGEER